MTEEMISGIGKQLEGVLAEVGNWIILKRPGDDAPFVQFTTAHRRSSSGEFDHSDALLILDLPCTPLTWEQSERAGKWFAAHGVEGPSELSASHDDERTFMLAAWQLNAGSDPREAARLALECMETTYELSGRYSLVVESGNHSE